MKKANRRNHIGMIIHFALIPLLGMVLSCAMLEPGPQSGASGDRPLGDGLRTDPEDRLERAYANFAMASLSIGRAEYEKARGYLSEAVKYDPDSLYLNMKMAFLLKQLQDFEGAARYAEKCNKLDPENIRCRILLAEIYAASGDNQSAIKEYERIIQIDPNQHKVRLILTTILIKDGQFNRALENLNLIIEQDPNLVIAHYYRGRIHLELGNAAEAEKGYLEVLKRNQTMEPALFDLGSLYQMSQKYEQAVETYERLLDLYPNNLIVRERLINLYYKLGQEDKAENQAEEIRKQSKPGDPGRQTLGLIYLKQGKLEKSIEELDLIVTAWPEDDKSRYYLASAHEEKGSPEDALHHFRMIKEESEYYVNAQMHISYILDSQEKHDEAVKVLEKVIQTRKDKVEPYLMLASIYEGKNEFSKAKEVILEGLNHHEKSIELIFRLGVILDKSGEKDECLTQMRRILELNPDHADALNYIGYTYAEQGIRLDEAMDLIQKALKIKPESGYIIDSLGWVYYQKGLYDEALSSLLKAVTYTPDDPTITEHLGDVYFKKKNYEKSLEMYEKALSLNHPDEEKIKEKIERTRKLSE